MSKSPTKVGSSTRHMVDTPMPRDIHEAVDWIGSLRSRIRELEAALECIALLDEADGHELTSDDASRAVAIATRTLGKHPSQIIAEREALSRTPAQTEEEQWVKNFERLASQFVEDIRAALDRARKEGLI